ncbi:MAG: nucleoside hydrolase [Bacteroidales bacterium]|nr:nucleoside hydrolase [Bacteroidales bacterium]HQP03342.1 nucleoside hydrolase [Bacteroidales bacterium]
MKKILLLLSVLLTFATAVFSHSGKARFHVIIDTDCAPDDLRAISMILASPDFEVIAITTSDGLLRPEEGYVKVKALLRSFGHDGIPVAYGKRTAKNNSNCHSTCISVNWGDENGITIPEKAGANELLIREINDEDEPVVLICLGPMTNISEILSDENIISQIEKVYWYCDDATNKSGFNYEYDKKSGDTFMNNSVAKCLVGTGESSFLVDSDFLNKISGLEGQYSAKISSSHKNEAVEANIAEKRYKLWDDLIPIFMIHPELFVTDGQSMLTTVKPIAQESQIKNAIFEMLVSKHMYENKVFGSFPLTPDLYADDVKPYVNEIISRHGMSEFRAGVLANELHGHLGIYAIIGVKMGIRVRQYFNISVDDVHVISYAGSGPPVSCLNDGLQVSTGGTVGHGLFEISDQEYKRPEATFIFKNKSVTLKLKDEYWAMIKSDVKATIDKCGNLTPAYWQELRAHAIRYWLEFDRMDIFEVVEN